MMKILKHLPSRAAWRRLAAYMGMSRGGRGKPIDSPAALGKFLHDQASFIAQTTLYGYLKTRAGTRFPALFEDAGMLTAINIAKWHMWLACLSDLAVYCGVLVRVRSGAPPARIQQLLQEAVGGVLAEVGIPEEAGGDFAAAAQRVTERIATADPAAYRDDGSAFSESPAALVRWAPVVEKFKEQDAEIMRNSVRFSWQEVRRRTRRALRAEQLVGGAG